MIEDILDRQKAFFRTGKTLSVSFRKQYLKDLRDAVSEMDGEISAALKEDLGKSPVESYMCETGMTLSELGHAVRHIREYSRRRRVHTPVSQFPAKSYIIPEPYGSVLIMSPWNYPFLLSLAPLTSAVAAGNTVILKPSAYSPATSAVIKKLVGKVFPEEYVAVAEGGRDVNAGLLEQKFDYIFFTGSKAVGRLVMSKASVHLTPVTLELGGKSPVIVDRTADIRTSARRIVFGKFLNCGQTCVAPDYVLVHEDVADAFVESCKAETAAMFGDDPIGNPDYGKIVNRKHFDRLVSWLGEIGGENVRTQEAVDGAARIVHGGRADAGRLKIEPTIVRAGSISGPSAERYTIMQEEIFGPVLPVLSYTDMDEVIRYVDGHPRPLAAYIFTEDRKTRETLLGRLHFGGGCVNDTIIHLATEAMPFGGVGESGMGNYHGRYGFETFSHLKSIVDKPVWLDLPMRYQPYGKMKDRIIRRFLR